MIRAGRLALALAAAALAGAAHAAPTDGTAVLYPRTETGSADKAPTGWGTTGTTILVVIFGAAAGWLAWTKFRGLRPMQRGAQELAIAETRSLGNRQFLVVAAYRDRKFLLGVCPGRIDLLAPLDGAAEPDK